MSRPMLMFAAWLAALVLSTAPVLAGTGWSDPETIWSANYWEASLVVHGGRPHVAAVGATGIWYLTRQGGSWTRTRLTTFSGDPEEPTDQSPSIAVDPADGSVTVAYVRREAEVNVGGCGSLGLRYVTNRLGDWSDPRRVGAPGSGSDSSGCNHGPSLAVTDGRIAVASVHGTIASPPRIRFFRKASGPWSVSSFAGAHEPSLVLDDSGRPRIAFWRFDEAAEAYDVWYARGMSVTGDFVREKVADDLDLFDSSSAVLALTAADKPRVAWSEPDGTHYAFRDGTGWHDSPVLAAAVDASLVIDDAGVAHIAAADGTNGLWYASGPQNGSSGDFDAVQVTPATIRIVSAIDLTDAPGRVHPLYERADRVWYVRSMA